MVLLWAARALSPFCLLRGQEVVQVLDNVLQAAQPSTQLFLNTRLVVTELGVEVLAVGGCAHGGTEDGLDHETVVLAEGVAVCGAERDADLLVAVGQVLAESLGGEVEGTVALSVWLGKATRMPTYRFNQTRPSVATCFFVLSSLRTRSWRFSESMGAASWRSRIF
jgi:hypothetical protein